MIGQWAITPDGRTDRPSALGVVSVPPREIPEQEGMLGIEMDLASTRPTIANVLPDTGAEAAGLRVGDVILSIDGVAVRNPAFDVTPAALVTGYVTNVGLLGTGELDRLRAANVELAR